jgi:PAB-dependent poly(A)-specific ribonuclease subunit 3
LACNSIAAVKRENWSQSLDIISRYFSNDLRQLIIFLVSGKPTVPESTLNGNAHVKSINDIMPMIGARFYNQLDQAYQRSDQIESELNRELDNSRLFRLLAKLGSVNERPEFKNDPNWSETGDRYMLKLFRDYLFHQNNEEGRPFLDLGHVVCTLNKLDVGSPEKILLMSRDQQNVLIVSFAELRRCFDGAFADLLSCAI